MDKTTEAVVLRVLGGASLFLPTASPLLLRSPYHLASETIIGSEAADSLENGMPQQQARFYSVRPV